MNSYKPEQVLNGTWGELWVSSEYLAEVVSFEAKVTLSKSDVTMTRTLGKGSKVTGYEGKGTIKVNKVTSFFIKLLSDNIKAGKQTTVTIISKLDDPDGLGTERIVIKDATFDELTLASWEAMKNGEESIPFTFTDWDVQDMIDA